MRVLKDIERAPSGDLEAMRADLRRFLRDHAAHLHSEALETLHRAAERLERVLRERGTQVTELRASAVAASPGPGTTRLPAGRRDVAASDLAGFPLGESANAAASCAGGAHLRLCG